MYLLQDAANPEKYLLICKCKFLLFDLIRNSNIDLIRTAHNLSWKTDTLRYAAERGESAGCLISGENPPLFPLNSETQAKTLKLDIPDNTPKLL
jgi:hypothetical protein